MLALQGAFREHINHVELCGYDAITVRSASELTQVDALIIPGGESTTIGKLMVSYGLVEPIKRRAEGGMPIFGTCAGAILLAGATTTGETPLLSLMNTVVERNAYGRQKQSFEADLVVEALGKKPLRAVFIRAPKFESAGEGVEVLASYDGRPVAVRQGRILATTFHPELTGDIRFHRFFVDEILI